MLPPLIVTLTPRGHELGLRMVRGLGRGEVAQARGAVRETLHDAFISGRPLVCVMALGIVVRTLGPLARDKHSDAAVLVVDESGRFVIPVLGGHAAGANALAHELAQALDALPVITTASDALGLPAVDQVGQDWGWQIESPERLTAAAAAVVRGEPVGVWQDAGRRDWWEPFGAWPASFTWLEHWPPSGRWAALLVISDRAGPFEGYGPVVVYRPPTLVLGVGCKRGVPCDEIEELFQEVCRDQGLAPLSLAVGPLPTPSDAVRARIGIAGVAEPAAMLAAGTRDLLMPKRRGRRVTMALARRDEA
jgi:cobalt-precorrin 5A hydrolase